MIRLKFRELLFLGLFCGNVGLMCGVNGTYQVYVNTVLPLGLLLWAIGTGIVFVGFILYIALTGEH